MAVIDTIVAAGAFIGSMAAEAGASAAIASAAAAATEGAIIGAVIGGVSAAVTGGNIGKGILYGGLIGGATAGIDDGIDSALSDSVEFEEAAPPASGGDAPAVTDTSSGNVAGNKTPASPSTPSAPQAPKIPVDSQAPKIPVDSGLTNNQALMATTAASAIGGIGKGMVDKQSALDQANLMEQIHLQNVKTSVAPTTATPITINTGRSVATPQTAASASQVVNQAATAPMGYRNMTSLNAASSTPMAASPVTPSPQTQATAGPSVTPLAVTKGAKA